MIGNSKTIDLCTLSQALEDGTLIDVSEVASAWFRCRVVMTRQLWADYIVPPEGVRSFFQNETARIYTVVDTLDTVVWDKATPESDTILFEAKLRMQPRPAPKEPVALKAVAAPVGYEPRHVIIMLREEE